MLLGTYRNTCGKVPNDHSQGLIVASLGIFTHLNSKKTESVTKTPVQQVGQQIHMNFKQFVY